MNQPLSSKTIARRFQPIMHDCRKMALSYLAPIFMRFLENADISLLEAADRAENNQQQAQYFAVMKALKNGRESLTQDFLGKLDKEFRLFIERGAQNPEEIDIDEISADKLRLIEKKEMEMALPVQNVVLRANSNYIEEIYGLEQRIAVINGGSKVFPESLPGGPVQIAHAFRDVISVFEADRKLRLMLFVGFDRDVMRELSGYLDEYNRRLSNAGVLPNLKFSVAKSVTNKRSGQSAEDGAEKGESDDGSYDEIRGHFGARRQQHAGTGGQRGAVTSQMVANTITDLQSDESEELFNSPVENYFEDIRVDHDFISELRETLNAQIENLFERLDRNKLEEADEDAIDLVGMLFDYMLQDENVPNVVKALLSRLQIPYLRVAINEKQLFVKKNHPARKLLDSMIDFGARWVVEDDLMRGIFPHLRTIVERIHDDHDLNNDLFRECLDDLELHVQQLEEKSQLIEKRSIAAAEGQERLEMARTAAKFIIQKTLRGKRIPDAAQTFFFEDWAEKMVFILLREDAGRDSLAWRNAIDTMSLICSVVEITENTVHRDQMINNYSAVCEKITFGLDHLRAFGRKDNDRILASIDDWHQQAMTFFDAIDEALESEVELPTPIEEDVVAEDISSGGDIDAAKQALVNELEKVPFGTWFEFVDENEMNYRLRLAWYSNVSRKFMFVDALGLKAADYQIFDLAEMMEKSQVRILSIENRPFFDRALDTIKGLLGRKSQ